MDVVPTYFVALADAMNGEWIEQPYLHCTALTRGCAPTIDQADLLWHFGTMRRESALATDPEFAYVPPLAALDKYVRITVPAHSLVWYGYIVAESIERGGQEDDGTENHEQRVAYGNQALRAYGLEWFLARETIHASWVHVAGDDPIKIDRAIGFNAGFGDGRSLSYADRGNQDVGLDLEFAASPDAATEWTARYAVEYLLDRHGPKNKDADKRPCTFQLHPAVHKYLNWYRPIVPTEGRSVFEALTDIINPRRSLAWWIEVASIDGDLTALVFVASAEPTAVELPGGVVIPAADDMVAITDSEIGERPLVTRDRSRMYDRIICRGARRRAVFTISHTAGNLAASWTSAEEAAYKTALGSDPDDNDRYRAANRFERVYQMFRVPADWDGTCNNGGSTPEATAFACPLVPFGTTSIVGGAKMAMPGLRLLRTMPIRVGWDYADATGPTPRDPDDTSSEWQRPFAIVDVDDGDWRLAHELGNDDEDMTPYHLMVLDGTPGFQLRPSSKLAHALGLNHFDGGDPGESNVDPEVDWQTIRCTVAAEWDAYCEGRYPAADSESQPLATLYISIGERARWDWLATGTIYDVENGALKTTNTGGSLRDDRDLCTQIAQAAHAWYSTERATVSYIRHDGQLPYTIGHLITTVGTAEAEETVNALVTQITHDFTSGAVSLEAGFAEVDFAGI